MKHKFVHPAFISKPGDHDLQLQPPPSLRPTLHSPVREGEFRVGSPRSDLDLNDEGVLTKGSSQDGDAFGSAFGSSPRETKFGKEGDSEE